MSEYRVAYIASLIRKIVKRGEGVVFHFYCIFKVYFVEFIRNSFPDICNSVCITYKQVRIMIVGSFSGYKKR